MVRMVRIIGVAALICTGLVLASIKWPVRPLRLGITQDYEARQFLERPSAVTRFNSRQDNNDVSANQDKTPPLVKQAQMLEEILNPRIPQAAPPATVANTRGPTPLKPAATTAKFNLIGISYSPSDPASCFAYIRLPDNTFQWIHQGSEIGHLTVKEVKSNSIVCFDGQRMSEMPVESTVDTASILETGVGSSASGRITAGSSPLSARLTGQDEAGLNELVHRLKLELQKENKSNQADSNAVSAEKAAAIGKLITEAKASQVGAEEAQNLEKLGEKLNGAKDNPKDNQLDEKRREILRRMSQPRSPKQ